MGPGSEAARLADVAAVGFAIGSRPGLPESEARELAEVLSHRRSLAALSLAGKIREQARRDPDRDVSQDVELELPELRELAAVLAEPRFPEELPAFAHLRDEVLRELGD
jgi:hypothetical protein